MNTSKSQIPRLGIFLIIIAAATCVGCEDLLPVYVAPERIFEATFVSLVPDTLTVRTNGEATQAQYPVMTVTYKVTNIYEETIQLTADLAGSIELWIPTRPEINSTVILTNDNIVPSAAFDDDKDIITLNPGASIFIRSAVNPKLNTGFYLHRYTTIRIRELRYTEFLYYNYYHPLTVAHRMSIQLERTTTGISASGGSVLVMTGLEPMPR